MTAQAIPPLHQWPDDLREEFYERAAIKADSMPVDVAEAQAMREAWERHMGPQEKLF